MLFANRPRSLASMDLFLCVVGAAIARSRRPKPRSTASSLAEFLVTADWPVALDSDVHMLRRRRLSRRCRCPSCESRRAEPQNSRDSAEASHLRRGPRHGLDRRTTFHDLPKEPTADVSLRGQAVSFFSAFAASFGSVLLVGTLIASWLFRSSDAPLVAKIAVPTIMVVLACATPYQVRTMLGFPISAPLATLPARAELIAFVAQGNDGRVDLWLREGGAPPRAYETALDDKLKQTLRDARNKLGHGRRVMLVKARPEAKRTAGDEPRASDGPGYELDDSAFSLPQKD